MAYLQYNEPSTEEILCELSVDSPRVQGAHRHSASRYPLAQLSSKHHVGQLAPTVREVARVPGWEWRGGLKKVSAAAYFGVTVHISWGTSLQIFIVPPTRLH